MEPFLVAEMIMTWLALPQLHVHAIVLALQSAVLLNRHSQPYSFSVARRGRSSIHSVTMLQRRYNFNLGLRAGCKSILMRTPAAF